MTAPNHTNRSQPYRPRLPVRVVADGPSRRRLNHVTSASDGPFPFDPGHIDDPAPFRREPFRQTPPPLNVPAPHLKRPDSLVSDVPKPA